MKLTAREREVLRNALQVYLDHLRWGGVESSFLPGFGYGVESKEDDGERVRDLLQKLA